MKRGTFVTHFGIVHWEEVPRGAMTLLIISGPVTTAGVDETR
jgi:hypothetical protein